MTITNRVYRKVAPLAQGSTGIVIGVATLPGASHGGAPLPGDTNAIDAPYAFFGNTGSDFTSIGITGGTATGLDMRGWGWTWNGVTVANMGGRLGNGIFQWGGQFCVGWHVRPCLHPRLPCHRA